jgi:serine/threonine-protein kinase haspin
LPPHADSERKFGDSGLEITILDYGLSRAENPEDQSSPPIAYDLEKDLSIFTSTHAPQCKVYRQMRSFLLKGDRVYLGPERHKQPYQKGPNNTPISWTGHHSYTNVVWLAYIYQYLVSSFQGEKKELTRFKRETKELASHLDPGAPRHVLSFSSAVDVVRFAAEAGWVTQSELTGDESRLDASELASVGGNESIIESRGVDGDDSRLRRSPRGREGPITN